MSNLQSLPIFQAVAEEKSFSQAAKKLKLTQPTISFHIDNLEKRFGCPLFLRTAKGVTLTVYGELLLASTIKISEIMQITENNLHNMLAGHSGQITVGASTIPGEYILPEIIAAFLQQNSGIRLSLKVADSNTILAGFERGEFPIAVIGIKPQNMTFCHQQWQDELVLVAHPDIWRTLNGTLSLTELEKQPLIIREQASGTRQSTFHLLAEHGLQIDKLNIVMETASNAALKSVLISQLGIGFVSRWAIRKELTSGILKIITIPEVNLERSFYVLRSNLLQPTCIDLFFEHLLHNNS